MPTAVFWCLLIWVWKQSDVVYSILIMVLYVYLWESQIQNMKYETNLATWVISKILNLSNEFDYDCNKSKNRNVTVILILLLIDTLLSSLAYTWIISISVIHSH